MTSGYEVVTLQRFEGIHEVIQIWLELTEAWLHELSSHSGPRFRKSIKMSAVLLGPFKKFT